jgi:hypothetical protein
LKGLTIASLSDVLFPANDLRAGTAVVAAAQRQAKALGADALLCSGTHAVLDTVLDRRGFFAIPGNLHFMARNDDDRIFPEPATEWWLTRGDGRSDGAF